MDELPAFIYWLLNVFQIPEELRSERFGIVHFHHPNLLTAIDILSPEAQLLDLIDSYLSHLLPQEFTARELEKLLRECVDRYLVDRLFTFNNTCGKFLGKLANSRLDRVQAKRSSTCRKWLITWANDNKSVNKN